MLDEKKENSLKKGSRKQMEYKFLIIINEKHGKKPIMLITQLLLLIYPKNKQIY